MKGIIFDFNGTLYWDSKLHYEAWREYSKILRGVEFTDEEMREKMFGHTNEDIIEYAIGKKPTKEMVEKWFITPPSPDRPTMKERFLEYFDSQTVDNYVEDVKNVYHNVNL